MIVLAIQRCRWPYWLHLLVFFMNSPAAPSVISCFPVVLVHASLSCPPVSPASSLAHQPFLWYQPSLLRPSSPSCCCEATQAPYWRGLLRYFLFRALITFGSAAVDHRHCDHSARTVAHSPSYPTSLDRSLIEGALFSQEPPSCKGEEIMIVQAKCS